MFYFFTGDRILSRITRRAATEKGLVDINNTEKLKHTSTLTDWKRTKKASKYLSFSWKSIKLQLNRETNKQINRVVNTG